MTALVWRGKCLRMRPGKESFQDVACSLEAKPAPSGANGNTVDQYRLKPLQREVVRPIRELEAESQNGNPGLTTFFRKVRPLVPSAMEKVHRGLCNLLTQQSSNRRFSKRANGSSKRLMPNPSDQRFTCPTS